MKGETDGIRLEILRPALPIRKWRKWALGTIIIALIINAFFNRDIFLNIRGIIVIGGTILFLFGIAFFLDWRATSLREKEIQEHLDEIEFKPEQIKKENVI